jgi:predicted RNase H-like HicB family nuclease
MTDTIEELERLLAAATEGPWKISEHAVRGDICINAGRGGWAFEMYAMLDTHPDERAEMCLRSDAALIVALRNAAPSLLATLKAVTAERDDLAEALAEAASELQVCFEALGEFANTLSREPYEANRAYSAMSDARKALESSK